jgi:hypothetical protein
MSCEAACASSEQFSRGQRPGFGPMIGESKAFLECTYRFLFGR